MHHSMPTFLVTQVLQTDVDQRTKAQVTDATEENDKIKWLTD